MSQKISYITTPIYYVNDIPHIGHAYTSLAADVLARFQRLNGVRVLFMTGTDEHGQKVEKSAHAADLDPKEFVDRVSERFQDLHQKLNISNDLFMRTTDPKHILSAQEMWRRIEQNGHIYKGSYQGWYAVRDEAYYAEKELIDGKAPTGADVEWVEEPCYFFRLSSWQENLLKFYKENPNFIGPESRRNEVLRFVEDGLKDLSISRSTFKWGVPVPGDMDHVMYVWIEALSIYVTALGFPNDQSETFKNFWPTSLHLMGKDIVRFHAVYWPAMLMAAGLTPPKRIFAHGWWTNEGQKISKSLGNVIDPYKLMGEFGVDPVRYFLLREVPFGQDGDFSRTALIQRVNSDLANDLGNLVQRVLSFINKNADARVPLKGDLTEADQALLTKMNQILEDCRKYAESQALNKMLEAIWEGVGEANRYVDSEQPWSLRKTDITRMNTVLYVLAEVIRRLGLLTMPFMPTAAEKILDYVGADQQSRSLVDWEKHILIPGAQLPKPEGVFPRIVEKE
ncbi:methionine--tRNA ligase [Candidatus Nucleicultrix amoebiphila]|jgi:methionyl-tRNA synthetase|uniref:Methionine--tRNA ligase n=1 Tax=Candidatus Nucleicultrix amoebiphila FS5 TaxID=1414854 RepID=A0A1W6N391_9PROT|nr:methionine--tRNA ligase [Candidatus Nucleicultrix amoebiphila]ARN84283.1 methionine--tRNA ligase [Candidatus Nucleicultrix amoebiphila FS5]